MAKEPDQPKETDEVKDEAAQEAAAEEKEQAKATAKAAATSDKFDKLIDADEAEGDEETPLEAPVDDDKGKGEKKGKEAEGDEETPPEKPESDETPAPEKKGADDEPPEVKVSDDVAKRAIGLGMTEEEIAEYGNDAELTKTLNVFQSIIDSDEEPETPTVGEPPQAPGAQTPAEKPAENKAEEDETSGLKFKNEDDIDPELLTNLKEMEKRHRAEVKELRDQVSGLLGKLHTEDETRFMGRFDGMVENLGTEFEDVFGKGKTTDLSRRGNAAKNRFAIRSRMFAFAKGLNDTGQTVPDEQALFDMAVNSLHQKKVKNVAGLRLHKKTSERSKQRIGRGAARRAGEQTPQQKAVETSRKFDDLIDTTED